MRQSVFEKNLSSLEKVIQLARSMEALSLNTNINMLIKALVRPFKSTIKVFPQDICEYLEGRVKFLNLLITSISFFKPIRAFSGSFLSSDETDTSTRKLSSTNENGNKYAITDLLPPVSSLNISLTHLTPTESPEKNFAQLVLVPSKDKDLPSDTQTSTLLQNPKLAPTSICPLNGFNERDGQECSLRKINEVLKSPLTNKKLPHLIMQFNECLVIAPCHVANFFGNCSQIHIMKLLQNLLGEVILMKL
ncbi:unnamed protein product [Lepeophtheirus salmonis]|uniref:(salmon louse) hypothetical protein n=1 Tax=Lepeophtheirus salmonis TaxID=72036 RepID=A0A817FBT6_LEPSM|nr:unnamed protein product [Lepeophtheirus salmonis]